MYFTDEEFQKRKVKYLKKYLLQRGVPIGNNVRKANLIGKVIFAQLDLPIQPRQEREKGNVICFIIFFIFCYFFYNISTIREWPKGKTIYIYIYIYIYMYICMYVCVYIKYINIYIYIYISKHKYKSTIQFSL